MPQVGVQSMSSVRHPISRQVRSFADDALRRRMEGEMADARPQDAESLKSLLRVS